jgi:glycosyltransferase involved in cell wall biosynthesis
MNILIIGTTDTLGGAAKVSWDIKRALESEGHDVSMLVADKRSDDPKVKVIPRQAWRKYLGFLLATDDLLKSDWILTTAEFKNADIVHCHNLHGRFFNLSTLQKMSKLKPVVWTLHDEWAITSHCAYTFEGTEIRNGLYVCPSIDIPPRLLWNNTAALSRKKNSMYAASTLHIVTPSLWLKERGENSSLKGQDIRHIPNGVDTKAFAQADRRKAREELGLPLHKRIVLFLANDAKNNTWKGWKYTEEVIKHFEGNDEVLFLSVGNHVVHADEKNVQHRGHVNDARTLVLYYSAADALLFTSIAENFPLVILEAMSAGLPIVSFDVGGVKEAVTHKQNGYVGRYKNTEDMIEGLNWALALNMDEKKALSEASAAKARACYDVSNMTARYINLYKELHEQDKSA